MTQVQTRFYAFKAMSEEELDTELRDINDPTNGFRKAIMEYDTARELAEKEYWWCPGSKNCDSYECCTACIENWLEQPYKPNKKEETNDG